MINKISKGVIVILFLSAAFASAELIIEAGTGITFIPDEPIDIFPDVRLLLGMDMLIPVSEEWSFSFEAGGAGFFKPIDQYSRYFYSAKTAMSVRKESFFFRTALSVDGEQQYFEQFPAVPDLYDNRFEIEFSFDIEDITLSFLPSVTWQKKELIGDLLSVEGSVRLFFLLSDTFICKADVFGSASIFYASYTRYQITPSLTFSWYPGIPFVLTEAIGVSFETSSYSEFVISESVKRKDFIVVFLNSQCAVSFDDTFLLTINLPARIKLFNYRAVVEGAFVLENEWVLYVGAEAGFAIIPSKESKWLFALMAEQPFSNSDYLGPGSISFCISFQLIL